MDKFFFKPRVGAYYDTGLINGIKVMILGASHYCLYNEKSTEFKCPNWAECTARENRDSSKYNTCCPWNQKMSKDCKIEIAKLEDTTISEIDDFLGGLSTNPSYPNFTEFMLDFIGENNPHNFWDYVLFYNYVQYFSSTIETPTLDERDVQNFYALLEILDHYSPDLIIVWGIQVTKHFKTKNIKSIADFKWRDGCGNYIFDLKYHEKQYTFINSYHPCDMYKWWSNHKDEFKEELLKVLPIDING